MELLDKGKHCQEEFCHQIDFLPMQCKACKKHFCSEHFKYEAHRCTESEKFNFKVPVCEICSKPIEFKRGRDLDLCLAEHLEKCLRINDETENGNKVTNEKKPTKKCSFEGCRSKENVFKFECESCSQVFCNKHRIPEVHNCRVASHKSCSQQFRSANTKKESNYFSVSSF